MTSSDSENQSEPTLPGKVVRPPISGKLIVGLPLIALLGSLIVGSIFAWSVYGLDGLLVCLAVWAVIAVSSALAYFAGLAFSTPDLAQAQIMIGMMIRTGVPLIFALVVSQVGQAWIDAGCIYYLFGFYFVGLAVDMFLILATSPMVRSGVSSVAGESVHVGR